jgi:hypothetical protein
VGCCHDKPKRRPRARICLRKGCGCKYQPRRWNQRYCQDPECQRLLRRWQAARRQARRRQDEAAKSEHAKAERARRARRRRISPSPQPPKAPEVTAARGHAAKIFSPTPLCDRPGCHEVPPKSGRSQSHYCDDGCRQAVQRVLARERKWQVRGTFRGQRVREREYQAARTRRREQPHDHSRAMPPRPPPS